MCPTIHPLTPIVNLMQKAGLLAVNYFRKKFHLKCLTGF